MVRVAKLDLPATRPGDAPLKSICINASWVEIIESTVTRLEYGAMWKPGTDIDDAEQQVFELYLLLREAIDGCGGGVKLRQNPLDKCQLQISYDDGQTWELAFDFGLCEAIRANAQATKQTYTNQQLGVAAGTYAGTNDPVAAATGVMGVPATSPDATDAYCTAWYAFIKSHVAYVIQQATVAGVITNVAVPVLPALLALGIVPLSITKIWPTLVSGDIVVSALDDVVIRDIACYAYERARISPYNPNIWYEALNGYSGTAGAQAVAAILYSDFRNDLRQWLAFLRLWGDIAKTQYRDCDCNPVSGQRVVVLSQLRGITGAGVALDGVFQTSMNAGTGGDRRPIVYAYPASIGDAQDTTFTQRVQGNWLSITALPASGTAVFRLLVEREVSPDTWVTVLPTTDNIARYDVPIDLPAIAWRFTAWNNASNSYGPIRINIAARVVPPPDNAYHIRGNAWSRFTGIAPTDWPFPPLP